MSFGQMAKPALSRPAETYQQTPGRPGGVEEEGPRKKKTEASIRFEADASFDAYVNAAYDAFDILLNNPSAIDSFISDMARINAEHMMKFADDGYRVGGGMSISADPEWVRGAINYVNGYLEDFGERLRAGADAGRDLEDYRWNVYLYPQEGRHLAYMWGVQQAMKERGARGWRRVLHPERSEEGPCDACIADSMIIHLIDEGFFEFHPNGVCTAQGVAFYVTPTAPIMEIPIPTKVTLPEMIRKIIEKLGRIGKRVIRRIRRE